MASKYKIFCDKCNKETIHYQASDDWFARCSICGTEVHDKRKEVELHTCKCHLDEPITEKP